MLHPKFTVNPRELAHCKMCCEPLYVLYDQSKRDYCYECLLEMSIDNAKEILR